MKKDGVAGIEILVGRFFLVFGSLFAVFHLISWFYFFTLEARGPGIVEALKD